MGNCAGREGSADRDSSKRYKLTYFNGRGRGEYARMIFAAARVPYEDNRIEFSDWPGMKPNTPLGSLPILEVNGKAQVVESKAINRYLAREFGFYGKNNLEATKIDMISEVLDDIWKTCIDASQEKDESKQEEVFKKLFTETAPKKLKFLEHMLNENDGGNSYFVGKSVTYADVNFICAMDPYLNKKNANGLDGYPKLKALRARVLSNQTIAAWISKRPVTDF